jgi:hypothetical protein
MSRLTERLEEVRENKANYERIRDKVKSSFLRNKKEKYASGLKQLIIAEKQLESKLPIIVEKRGIL